MKLKTLLSVVVILLSLVYILFPVFISTSRASSFAESYIFFERMKVNTASDIRILFTPNSDFVSSEHNRFMRIFFPGQSGDWCKTESSLDISGLSSSAVDIENWGIVEPLPGSLSAFCVQSENGDYIEIENIGELTEGVGYGFEISRDSEIFRTTENEGLQLITLQLVEGFHTENISFEKIFLDDDQIVVSAMVGGSDSITCTVDSGDADFGVLYKGGLYSTTNINITTEATTGFYWAVYSVGGWGSEEPGLYNSTAEGHLLSSVGVDGRVNLLTDEGFGMVVISSTGIIPENFSASEPGIFGAIGMGFDQAKLFFHSAPIVETVNTQVVYGARAGFDALSGDYNETLTYVCGSYIGEDILEE